MESSDAKSSYPHDIMFDAISFDDLHA
jgi:hypothetical protein